MDAFRRLSNQLQSVINQMTMSQKATILMFALVVIISLFMLMMWGSRSEMRPIVDVNDKRATEIQTKLKDLGIKTDLKNGKVVVDAEKWDRVTMMLAAENLLPAEMDYTWSNVLDDTSLTTTRSLREMKYKRALENSIGSIIESMDPVSDAQVTISLPSDTVFLRDVPPVTASVLLKLARKKRLAEESVEAITYLVSHGVKGLEPEQVAIIDSNGRQYKKEDMTSASGMADRYLKLKKTIEQDYATKARLALSFLNKVNAVATVDLDMDVIREEWKDLDYQNTGAIALRDTKSQSSSNSKSGGGNPGVSPNIGDSLNDTVGETSESKDKTNDTTYDVDTIMKTIQRMPGTIKKRSIAVVIPYKREPQTKEQREQGLERASAPYSAEEIATFTEHIRSALDMAADEKISMISALMEFEEEPEGETTYDLIRSFAAEYGRYIFLGTIVIVMLLVMVNMMKATTRQMQTEREREYQFLEEQVDTLDEPEVLGAQARLLQEKITEMVHDNPQRAARLANKWAKE